MTLPVVVKEIIRWAGDNRLSDKGRVWAPYSQKIGRHSADSSRTWSVPSCLSLGTAGDGVPSRRGVFESCAGRGFTIGPAQRYAGSCLQHGHEYGRAHVRHDRAR